MPRYFFNVFGHENIFDDVGTELPSKAEARERMIFIAMEFVESFKIKAADNWQMEALDESGAIVATMDFCIEFEQRSSIERH